MGFLMQHQNMFDPNNVLDTVFHHASLWPLFATLGLLSIAAISLIIMIVGWLWTGRGGRKPAEWVIGGPAVIMGASLSLWLGFALVTLVGGGLFILYWAIAVSFLQALGFALAYLVAMISFGIAFLILKVIGMILLALFLLVSGLIAMIVGVAMPFSGLK